MNFERGRDECRDGRELFRTLIDRNQTGDWKRDRESITVQLDVGRRSLARLSHREFRVRRPCLSCACLPRDDDGAPITRRITRQVGFAVVKPPLAGALLNPLAPASNGSIDIRVCRFCGLVSRSRFHSLRFGNDRECSGKPRARALEIVLTPETSLDHSQTSRESQIESVLRLALSAPLFLVLYAVSSRADTYLVLYEVRARERPPCSALKDPVVVGGRQARTRETLGVGSMSSRFEEQRLLGRNRRETVMRPVVHAG